MERMRLLQIYKSQPNGLKGWEKSFYTHVVPSHLYGNILTKHFHLTSSYFTIFQHWIKGKEDADTYSVGIMVMIWCFWHFPKQFVHD